MSSKYKQFDVSRKQTIKKFVESRGHTFSVGTAFVELTEPEEVSGDKIIVATEDGSTFLTGADLRKAIRAPTGNKKFTLDPSKHAKYSFFAEVKGHNKQVSAGTKVLVKCDEETAEETGETTLELLPSTAPIATPDPIPFPKRKGAKRTVPEKTVNTKKLATEESVTSNEVSAPTPATNAITIRPVVPAVGEYEDIQIVFSYDTTGSMSACIERVKRTVQQTIRRLLAASDKIEVGHLSN